MSPEENMPHFSQPSCQSPGVTIAVSLLLLRQHSYVCKCLLWRGSVTFPHSALFYSIINLWGSLCDRVCIFTPLLTVMWDSILWTLRSVSTHEPVFTVSINASVYWDWDFLDFTHTLFSCQPPLFSWICFFSFSEHSGHNISVCALSFSVNCNSQCLIFKS